VGRLVAQMYLDQPWRVKQSVGIELSLERHEWALHALAGLEQHQQEQQQQQRWLDSMDDSSSSFSSSSSSVSSCDGTVDLGRTTNNNNDDQSIKFHHGNVLEVNEWRKEATHMFISSLCFPEPVLEALQQIILGGDPVEEDMDPPPDNPDTRDGEEDRGRRRRRRQRGGVPHKTLQVVASLNRLGRLYESEEWDERTTYIQMSWGPGTVKIYRRKKLTPQRGLTDKP